MNEAAAGLYLHIPFCARVCPYCDFAVRTGDRARRRRFVDHLLAEIELYAGCELEFDTIYFGGGTPSSLEPEDLARILDACRAHLSIHRDCRLFLEANPEDVDSAAVAAWRGLGVDTLSIGVQSLDAGELAFLGRAHGPQEARDAVERAREAAFRAVSIDLIYGLPGQRAESWRAALHEGIELGPDHLSCYQLTIHRGTRFGLLERRGELIQMPSREQGELFRSTHLELNAAGYAGYEVSNFARAPEHRSRHNAKYWDHTPYLGLGPSAHSYRDGRRWWNVRRTDAWQDEVARGERPVEGSENLDPRTLALETLMTGLRTYDGVDLEALRRRWGVELLRDNGELLERLESRGLLSVERDRLVPTLDGLAVADSLAASFELGD